MGPPQMQGAPSVPRMGVRARVSNWSKKLDAGDSLGPSVTDGPAEDSLDVPTGFRVSRRTLVRSSSELTVSDLGSENVDPAGAALTRRYGSSSSVDLLGFSRPRQGLRVDQEPVSAGLSPSLQAAVQIASGDIVLEASPHRRVSDKASVLSRRRHPRTDQRGRGCALTPHRCFSHYDVQSVLLTAADSQAGPVPLSSDSPDLLPPEGREDNSSLVLACPQFLSEVGGERDRNLDLAQFCSKAVPGSWSNAAVSVLEASSETQLGSADGLENLDLGARYYQRYFYGRDHQNYFGFDPKFGPVSLSVRREVPDDERNPTNYRIILRTGQLLSLRGSVVEDSVPSSSKHRTSRGLPLKDVLEFIVPELHLQSLRLASSSPRVPERLLQLDQQELVSQHRVDLLLSRPGQNTGQTSCPALTQFLNLLSHRDPVKSSHQSSCGPRTSSADPGLSTGSQSVYTTFREFQLTFHVTGLAPTDADQTTQALRTRPVGDDITVIFQEPGAPPFNPRIVRFHTQQVFIVVRVHQPCSQHTCYSLAVSRCRDVPAFGPPIPPGWMFPASSSFVDFLLTKIINAKHAARRARRFVAVATRSRQERLQQLVETFATSTPLDGSSGVRFSLISLGGRRKERPAPRPLAYMLSAGALTWSVTARRPDSSSAVACRLAVSGELVVLVEEAGGKVAFHCFCRDVIGWTAAHGSVKLFYRHGHRVAFSTRGGRREDSQEITQRLQTVTRGAAAAAVTLRRNRLGQLGFHVNLEGVVADVEAHGFAWQAGLRPGCRLLEICLVAVATLSHEEMIELLRTSANVSAVVVPPHPDGTPRRSFSETHRLPLLEVRPDSDVTSCLYVAPGAPPTARVPSNQSPVQRSSSSRAAADWLIGSDESTESRRDGTSGAGGDKGLEDLLQNQPHQTALLPSCSHPETKPRCCPPRIPPHVNRVLSPADGRKQQLATHSCSSCSNTLSSISSDGAPQLLGLRGVSVDSGIDSAHFSLLLAPQVAGATLVLTDDHVTAFRRAGSASRCSSVLLPAASLGDGPGDAEPLYSQDTCPWEAGLSRRQKRSLLEEKARPGCRPIRGVCGAKKSSYGASVGAAPSPRKRLSRSRSHDRLSVASCSRATESPAHFLRRHRSVPSIGLRGMSPPPPLARSQEVRSGSPALTSDITASLSGKVAQLKEKLCQLQLDLLKEQQDKAALQQQVLELRRDNLRLRARRLVTVTTGTAASSLP